MSTFLTDPGAAFLARDPGSAFLASGNPENFLTDNLPVEHPDDPKHHHYVLEAVAIAGAFLAWRHFFGQKAKDIGPPDDPRTALQVLWKAYAPTWLKIARPAIVDIYDKLGGPLTQVEREYQAAVYAGHLGQHVHESSAEALIEGYNAELARGVNPHIAWHRATEAYGLDSPRMRGWLMAQRQETPYQSETVPTGARRQLDKMLMQRATVLGETEAWHAREVGKSIVWLAEEANGTLPVGTYKRWVTAHDEKVCPICGPLDKEEVPVKERFTVDGRTLWAPGLHPNCRCSLELVLPTDTLEKRLRKHTRESFAAKYEPGKHLVPVRHLTNLVDSQPRDPRRVKDLASQIKTDKRIKNPIAVSRVDGKAYLMNGHHRRLAAKELGMRKVPVQVRDGEYRDFEVWKDDWLQVDWLSDPQAWRDRELIERKARRLPKRDKDGQFSKAHIQVLPFKGGHEGTTERERDDAKKFTLDQMTVKKEKWPNGYRAYSSYHGARNIGHIRIKPNQEIGYIKTHPAYRQKGVASALVAHAEKDNRDRPVFHAASRSELGDKFAQAHEKKRGGVLKPISKAIDRQDYHRDQSGKFTSVGFTGTRKGMTDRQRNAVRRLLISINPKQVHHGDAVGADTDFHELARELDIPIHLHPPEDDKLRSRVTRGAASAAKPKPYMARNHDIVDSSEILIATPLERTEQRRSGTWATVRHARKTGKHVVVVTPGGGYKMPETINKNAEDDPYNRDPDGHFARTEGRYAPVKVITLPKLLTERADPDTKVDDDAPVSPYAPAKPKDDPRIGRPYAAVADSPYTEVTASPYSQQTASPYADMASPYSQVASPYAPIAGTALTSPKAKVVYLVVMKNGVKTPVPVTPPGPNLPPDRIAMVLADDLYDKKWTKHPGLLPVGHLDPPVVPDLHVGHEVSFDDILYDTETEGKPGIPGVMFSDRYGGFNRVLDRLRDKWYPPNDISDLGEDFAVAKKQHDDAIEKLIGEAYQTPENITGKMDAEQVDRFLMDVMPTQWTAQQPIMGSAHGEDPELLLEMRRNMINDVITGSNIYTEIPTNQVNRIADSLVEVAIKEGIGNGADVAEALDEVDAQALNKLVVPTVFSFPLGMDKEGEEGGSGWDGVEPIATGVYEVTQVTHHNNHISGHTRERVRGWKEVQLVPLSKIGQ